VIAGALRRDELLKMKVSDVEDKDSILILTVPDSKTHSERIFTVSKVDNIKFITKYQSLRPSNASSERPFLRYAKRKCYN
jgi:integrase